MTKKVHPQHFNGVHTASDKSEDPLESENQLNRLREEIKKNEN